MTVPDADAELLQLFQDETTERLDDMDTALLAAEARNVSADTIDALFRNAHTIKGAAGILGFSDMAALAHAVEDILSVARLRGDLRPDLAAPLLRATAALRARVNGAAAPFEALIAELKTGLAALDAGRAGAGAEAGAWAGTGAGTHGPGAGPAAGAEAVPAGAETVPARADGDPTGAEPAWADGDPTGAEPAWADGDPTRAEPAWADGDPTRAEPAWADGDPTRAEPAPAWADGDPTRAEPAPAWADGDPTGAEPAWADGDPTGAEPAWADGDPTRAEPAPAWADGESTRAERGSTEGENMFTGGGAGPGPAPLATAGSWAARAGTGRPASLPQPRPAFGPGNGAPTAPAATADPPPAGEPPRADQAPAGQPPRAGQAPASPPPSADLPPAAPPGTAAGPPVPATAPRAATGQAPAAPAHVTAAAAHVPADSSPQASVQAVPAGAAGWSRDAGRRSVRVPAEKIDHLLDLVGEVMQDRRRLAHALGAAEGLPTDAADELSAGERMLGELKDSAVGMRTLPVSMITGPLPRAVRDLARTIGREVEFTVVGAETELDRVILESLSEPLTHLLRNAVIHGIEPPAERELAGKPARGRIELRAVPRGGLVEITVSDDGRGVSAAIVEEARREGSLADVLARAGFSTAGEVTDLAGRGVGLDAVKAHVHSLGGRFEVSSEPGHGMAVSLLLPVALALLKVLLIQRGEAVFGLPIAGVDEVVTVDATTTLQGRTSLDLRGRSLPVVDLAAVIGADARPLPRKPPALVLTADGRWLAAACDRLLGEEEVVVKPLGPLLAGVGGYLGAAILGDGRIALLVEPGALIRGHRRTTRGGLPAPLPPARAVPAPQDAGPARPAPDSRAAAPGTTLATARPLAPGKAALPPDRDNSAANCPGAGPAPASPGESGKILVVEDSFIVRELQRCVLESAGHAVVTASDGREALDALARDEQIELVVTDLEMPRLGGLELTRTIRADERRSSLPVVMVTSRGSEEDRRRGMEAGVDAYIDKQGFQQSALLATITQLLGR